MDNCVARDFQFGNIRESFLVLGTQADLRKSIFTRVSLAPPTETGLRSNLLSDPMEGPMRSTGTEMDIPIRSTGISMGYP